MKTIFLSLVFIGSLSVNASVVSPKNIAEAVMFTAGAPVITSSCMFGDGEQTIDGEVVTNKTCNYASTVSLVTASVILKEVKAVQSDALLYVSGESATPALVSIIERIQLDSAEEGKDLSFEEIVDLITMAE